MKLKTIGLFSTALVGLSLLFSCAPKKKNLMQPGNYLVELFIDGGLLSIPIDVQVEENGNWIFKNHEEKIVVEDVVYKADSVFVTMPVFGSTFVGRWTDDDELIGLWTNINKVDYHLPFKAKAHEGSRFKIKSDVEDRPVNGTYSVTFVDAEQNFTPAIGKFQTNDNNVYGTFLTETGDYRYLEGNINGDQMALSTFDGAHAFLFTANISEDGKLNGVFRSGNHWLENYFGEKDDNASLSDAHSLTYLREGADEITFEFPDEHGNLISYPNDELKGKVVLLQIFGTWCPNCMDETRLFTEYYEEFHKDGLEIIGLDFEPNTDVNYFKARVERYKKDLNVPWDVVLAGPADKEKAIESLPMLNAIISYPTTIFIDRNGDVRSIHTGFTGPGTGQEYEDVQASFRKLLNQLIYE